MLVPIVGGFDLSGGAVVAPASPASALATVRANGVFPDQTAVIVTLGVIAGLDRGLIVGLVNSLGVALLRLSSYVVSLGTMSIATGFALPLIIDIPDYGMLKPYVGGFGRGL
jgi:ribose transport system permease protein